MTQEEFDKAPLLDQILYDETGMLVENHPSIAKAMEKYHQAKLKLLGIANVSTRFYLWFSMKKGWINAKLWMFKSDFNNFIWFQKRAFKCLVGKEGIIDSREVKSKGGYKYLQLEISKMPVSKTDVVS